MLAFSEEIESIKAHWETLKTEEEEEEAFIRFREEFREKVTNVSLRFLTLQLKAILTPDCSMLSIAWFGPILNASTGRRNCKRRAIVANLRE